MKESAAAVTIQVAGSDEEPRRSLRRSTALTIAGQMALVVIYITKYFRLSISMLPESVEKSSGGLHPGTDSGNEALLL